MRGRRSVIALLVALAIGVGVWFAMAAVLRASVGPQCEGEHLLRGSDRPDVVLDRFGCRLSTGELVGTWAAARAQG